MPRKITGRAGMPKMELTCPSCGKMRIVQYREPSRRNNKCKSCALFKGGRKPAVTKGWTKDSWAENCKKNGIPGAKKFTKELSGEKHYNWKGGITPENKRERSRIAAKLWRDCVFLRDNYTCQYCKERGKNLHAHHIEPFSKNKELRFYLQNGVTLCKDCHINVVHQGNTRSRGIVFTYPYIADKAQAS